MGRQTIFQFATAKVDTIDYLGSTYRAQGDMYWKSLAGCYALGISDQFACD